MSRSSVTRARATKDDVSPEPGRHRSNQMALTTPSSTRGVVPAYPEPLRHLRRRITPLGNLRDRIALGIVTEIACPIMASLPQNKGRRLLQISRGQSTRLLSPSTKRQQATPAKENLGCHMCHLPSAAAMPYHAVTWGGWLAFLILCYSKIFVVRLVWRAINGM